MPTLKIGRDRYEVADLVDASRVYQEKRDESGQGASTFPTGRCGKYLISYNGRVWESPITFPGRKPVLEATPLQMKICAWCKKVLREGTTPATHGMCPACAEKGI